MDGEEFVFLSSEGRMVVTELVTPGGEFSTPHLQRRVMGHGPAAASGKELSGGVYVSPYSEVSPLVEKLCRRVKSNASSLSSVNVMPLNGRPATCDTIASAGHRPELTRVGGDCDRSSSSSDDFSYYHNRRSTQTSLFAPTSMLTEQLSTESMEPCETEAVESCSDENGVTLPPLAGVDVAPPSALAESAPFPVHTHASSTGMKNERAARDRGAGDRANGTDEATASRSVRQLKARRSSNAEAQTVPLPKSPRYRYPGQRPKRRSGRDDASRNHLLAAHDHLLNACPTGLTPGLGVELVYNRSPAGLQQKSVKSSAATAYERPVVEGVDARHVCSSRGDCSGSRYRSAAARLAAVRTSGAEADSEAAASAGPRRAGPGGQKEKRAEGVPIAGTPLEKAEASNRGGRRQETDETAAKAVSSLTRKLISFLTPKSPRSNIEKSSVIDSAAADGVRKWSPPQRQALSRREAGGAPVKPLLGAEGGARRGGDPRNPPTKIASPTGRGVAKNSSAALATARKAAAKPAQARSPLAPAAGGGRSSPLRSSEVFTAPSTGDNNRLNREPDRGSRLAAGGPGLVALCVEDVNDDEINFCDPQTKMDETADLSLPLGEYETLEHLKGVVCLAAIQVWLYLSYAAWCNDLWTGLRTRARDLLSNQDVVRLLLTGNSPDAGASPVPGLGRAVSFFSVYLPHAVNHLPLTADSVRRSLSQAALMCFLAAVLGLCFIFWILYLRQHRTRQGLRSAIIMAGVKGPTGPIYPLTGRQQDLLRRTSPSTPTSRPRRRRSPPNSPSNSSVLPIQQSSPPASLPKALRGREKLRQLITHNRVSGRSLALRSANAGLVLYRILIAYGFVVSALLFNTPLGFHVPGWPLDVFKDQAFSLLAMRKALDPSQWRPVATPGDRFRPLNLHSQVFGDLQTWRTTETTNTLAGLTTLRNLMTSDSDRDWRKTVNWVLAGAGGPAGGETLSRPAAATPVADEEGGSPPPLTGPASEVDATEPADDAEGATSWSELEADALDGARAGATTSGGAPGLALKREFSERLEPTISRLLRGLVLVVIIESLLSLGYIFLAVRTRFWRRLGLGRVVPDPFKYGAYKRVACAYFLFIAVCYAIAYGFLINYPHCTGGEFVEPDSLPERTLSHQTPYPSSDGASVGRYIVYSKSFPMWQPTADSSSSGRGVDLGGGSLGGASASELGGTAPLQPAAPFLNVDADLYLPLPVLREFLQQMTSERGEYDGDWTFFTATRYNRRVNLRWPFTGMSVWGQRTGLLSASVYAWPSTKGFLDQNMPVVVVDTRGSGSSAGHRIIDLDEPEIEDILQIAAWTKHQFWANGKIAAGGVSYDGMTGIKLASGRAGAAKIVNAVVPLYSPLSPTRDLIQADGLPCDSFVRDYGEITREFEKSGTPLRHFLSAATARVPAHVTLGFIFTFGLPQAAKGTEEFFETEGFYMRQKSWDLIESGRGKAFLDDEIQLSDGRVVHTADGALTAEDFKRFKSYDLLTYWTAAHCDASASRNALAFFQTHLDHDARPSGHRLVIGPWGHGGRRTCWQQATPEQGTWSCGDAGVYKDAAQFLRSGGRPNAVSEMLVWSEDLQSPRGGVWLREPVRPRRLSSSDEVDPSRTMIRSSLEIADEERRRTFVLRTGELEKGGPVPPAARVAAVAHYLRSLLHPNIQSDFRIHWNQRQLSGLAHDGIELLTHVGWALNNWVETVRLATVTFVTRPLALPHDRDVVRLSNQYVAGTAIGPKQVALLLAAAGPGPAAAAGHGAPDASVTTELEPGATDFEPQLGAGEEASTELEGEGVGAGRGPSGAPPSLLVADMSSSPPVGMSVVSRWPIVQHLTRIPTDELRALQISLAGAKFVEKMRSGLRFLLPRGRRGPSAAAPYLKMETAPVANFVRVFGMPTVSITYLVSPELDQLKPTLDSDIAAVAILLETDANGRPLRYLSEGKGLLSVTTHHTQYSELNGLRFTGAGHNICPPTAAPKRPLSAASPRRTSSAGHSHRARFAAGRGEAPSSGGRPSSLISQLKGAERGSSGRFNVDKGSITAAARRLQARRSSSGSYFQRSYFDRPEFNLTTMFSRSMLREDHQYISDFYRNRLQPDLQRCMAQRLAGAQSGPAEAESAAVDSASVVIKAQLNFIMELVSAVIRPGNKLQLLLLPEEHHNFPWSAVVERYEARKTSSSNQRRLQRLTTWRLPLGQKVGKFADAEEEEGLKLNIPWLELNTASKP